MKYTDVKIGDRVVKFSYWNTKPDFDGIVTAFTDHFVQVEIKKSWSTDKEWFSKESIEVVEPPK